jgi:small subunit ribosomal protein S17
MPRKKTEETAAETTTEATTEAAPTSEETSTETQSADSAAAAGDDTAGSSSIVGSIIDTVSSAVETVASTVGSVATTITDAVGLTGGADEAKTVKSHRAQRIGVVTSDKMTKTVVVRVDRLIKHPKYRRYVRRKKQFMAHDELGATTGDKVRIVETRPLSARKRWRVIEIVQKAAK